MCNNMRKAFAYCRFSSDNQREESIDAQVRAIKEYCKRNEILLVHIYPDEAKSATTDNRPQFLKMIDDCKTADIDAVIVHKLDRFSRNRYDSAIYKNELKKRNISIISVLENLDDSPESIILESVLEGMSEYYSRNLSREVIKGKMETAYQCKHNGGIPPLGYDVAADKTYTINKYEAEAVKTIFKMFVQGDSYSEIALALHNQGYKTKLGRKFTNSAFYSILTNEKYIGTYVFNRTVPQPRGGKRSNESRPDDEILRIPNGIPAIIDNETWSMTQELLKRRKTMAGKGERKAKETYLLSGIIKCGNCGGAMVGSRRCSGRNKAVYYSYECNTRKRLKTCKMKSINRDYIENLVIDYLEQNILTDQAIKNVKLQLIEMMQTIQDEKPQDIETLNKELIETKKQINNIIDAVAAGMFNPAMKERMDELEAKQNQLTILLENANIQMSTSVDVDTDTIDTYLKRYRNIKQKSREEQRQIIQTFITEVIVYDGPEDSDKKVSIKGRVNLDNATMKRIADTDQSASSPFFSKAPIMALLFLKQLEMHISNENFFFDNTPIIQENDMFFISMQHEYWQ